MCPVTGSALAAALAAGGAAPLVGGIAAASVGTTLAAATAAAATPGFFASLALAIPTLTTGQSFVGSLLMSSVSQLFSFASQSKNAAAAQTFQDQRAEEVRAAANVAFLADADAENLRLQQEAIAASGQAFKATISRAKAVSTARTASGEAGVAGLSVDALIRDFKGSESRFREGLKENLLLSREQSKLRLEGLAAKAGSRINAARPQAVPTPSFLGAALRIGKEGFDSFEKLTTDASGRRRPLNF